MRARGRIAVVFVMVVLLLSVGTVWAEGQKEADGEKVYINGIDPDFPPFGYIDEAGNPAGFDVESVDWIAEEMGFEVKHQPTAWDGIIPSLQAGKIDFIASGMSILPEREKVISFTIPYWETKLAVAVRDDSDLSYEETINGDHKIGVQRGTTAAMWIEDNLINTGKMDPDMIVNYDSFSIALKDLANGRIDSAMQDDTMVIDAMKSQPIKIAGTHKSGMAYGYGVRQEDNELREMLNEGIRRLQKSPRWDELKEKYDM